MESHKAVGDNIHVWCTMLLYFQHVTATAQAKYGGKEQLLADVTIQSSRDEVKEDSLVEALVSNALPMKQGLPLVEDWDCLRVSFCSVAPSAVLPGSGKDFVDASYPMTRLSLLGTVYMPRFEPCSLQSCHSTVSGTVLASKCSAKLVNSQLLYRHISQCQ